VLNSRGNCHNSLGEWAEARADYQASSELFQRAKGFRGRGGSTTMRLDGAIFAASNAALMLAQMGDEDGAVKEVRCCWGWGGLGCLGCLLARLGASGGARVLLEWPGNSGLCWWHGSLSWHACMGSYSLMRVMPPMRPC
jgi:hypothetical protein